MLTIILAIFFVSGIAIFSAVPSGINRQLNQYTTTIDNINICYDIFEPKDDSSDEKTAIILGHGVMVNKNFMRTIALDLASQGFVVAALDFRGHGRSGGSLRTGNITDDIRAVKAVLANRGDINMSNLGYLGYSMGGGAGFNLLDTDTDFKAMVSLAAGGRIEYTTPNLLILHGKWDEAVSYDDILAYMENKTGLAQDNIQEDQVYGTFEDGTALKLFVSNADHLLAPYDLNSVRESRNWFLQALTGESNPSPNFTTYYIQLGMVLGATLCGFLMFLAISTALIKKFATKSEKQKENTPGSEPADPLEGRSIIKQYWIFVIPLSIPCAVFALPLFVLPLFYMNLFYVILVGPSMAVLFYMLYISKKRSEKFGKLYTDTCHKTSLKNISLGVVLGSLLYIILCLSIGYIFGIVPAATKWGWAILYGIIMVFIFLNFSLFSQSILSRYRQKDGLMKGILTNFLMLFLPMVVIVLLSVVYFGSWFNIQFLIPLVPLLLIQSTISSSFYKKNEDLLISVVATSVFLTLILITLVNL